MDSRGARIATGLVLGLHGLLLVASLADFRVSIDSGYHVSLARHYAEHGFRAWWDDINWGPAGRPNLQGPLMHMVVGALGKLLGGSGEAYVLGNTILAMLQWAAAMWTVVFFARRYAGDLAALFAAALLSGSLASITFAIGIPSGWIFIASPWAIHFFMQQRLALATFFAVAGIYCHLGGYLTAPAGILIAALLTRRFKSLLVVGTSTAVLTLPYTIHFLRYRGWYRGAHGHVATLFTPLTAVLALAGLVMLLRRPRANAFLAAWALAPIAWLFQDYTRFLSQSMLAGSAIGGLLLAHGVARLGRRARVAAATAFVLLATIYPLGIPALVAELRQAARLDYPKGMEWSEARTLAAVLERESDVLGHRLLYCYNHSFGPALAVWAPVQLEKGHWVEVQPEHDPASRLGAATKVYVLPLAPSDPTVSELAGRGWVEVHGGTGKSVVVTLRARPVLAEAARAMSEIAAHEADWLAKQARNNTIDPVGEVLFSKAGIAERRALLTQQRFSAGRIELVALIYAWAAEPVDPALAERERGAVRGWASLAAFLSDEFAVDFVPGDRHERLKQNLASWSVAVRTLASTVEPSAELGRATAKVFGEYFLSA